MSERCGSRRVAVGHTSGGGLAGIDVTNNDDVDMSLLFTVAGKKISKVSRRFGCFAPPGMVSLKRGVQLTP